MTFGFQKALKHYYLQGLHQNVVNADLYINGTVWNGMSDAQRKAIEVAGNAALMKAVSYRIRENGIALDQLVTKEGVILHDTPKEYFTEYANSALKVFQKNADENPFFKKVWDSQRDFARTAIPYWAQSQRTNANITGAYAKVLADEAKKAKK